MEANTEQKEWFIPCCFNEKCQHCKGSGKIFPERCPIYYYRDVKTLRVIYDNYENKNMLPYSGALVDQPKVMFDYFQLISHYVYIFREVKDREKERKTELINKMKSRLNGK